MDARLEFKLSGEAGNSLVLGSLTDVLPKAAPGMDTKNKRTNARAQGMSPQGSIPPQISAQEAGLFSVKTQLLVGKVSMGKENILSSLTMPSF